MKKLLASLLLLGALAAPALAQTWELLTAPDKPEVWGQRATTKDTQVGYGLVWTWERDDQGIWESLNIVRCGDGDGEAAISSIIWTHLDGTQTNHDIQYEELTWYKIKPTHTKLTIGGLYRLGCTGGPKRVPKQGTVALPTRPPLSQRQRRTKRQLVPRSLLKGRTADN
jgi:hypothetical protein